MVRCQDKVGGIRGEFRRSVPGQIDLFPLSSHDSLPWHRSSEFPPLFPRLCPGTVHTVFLWVVLAGCCVTPSRPAPVPDPVSLECCVTCYRGSLLAGPGGHPSIRIDLAGADLCRFTVIGLAKMPADAFSSLGSSSRLVFEHEGVPLAPSVQLLSRTRFTAYSDCLAFEKLFRSLPVGRKERLAAEWAVLPAGMTTVLSLTGDSEMSRNRRPPPRCRLRLLVHRPSGSKIPQVALGMQFLSDASADSALDRGELVLVDPDVLKDRNRMVFFLPSPFPRDWPRALAIGVEMVPPPPSTSPLRAVWARAASRCMENLGAATPGSTPAPLTRPQALQDPGAAIEGLRWRDHRRDALVYLAGRSGADLTGAILYILPAKLLRTLAAKTHAHLTGKQEGKGALSRNDIAWILDRAALHLLSAEVDRGRLLPELEAILIQHVGEVARHPDLLEEFADTAENQEAFRDLVLEENRLFLENVSPASRIRAHDWLAERGAVPEGYDPLAPARTRRRALRTNAGGKKQ